MTSLQQTILSWLNDEGYSVIIVTKTILAIFAKVKPYKVHLHIDGDWLVIELPYEMAVSGKRPHQNFAAVFDINSPDSLESILKTLKDIWPNGTTTA